MIEITCFLDKNYIIRELEVTGHANFNKKGEDIVCAGVSTLIYSFLLTISKNNVNYELVDKNRIFNIKLIKWNDNLNDYLKGICEFLINGIILLEKNYSNNVKLIMNTY